MRNITTPIYSIEDEANRLDTIVCKLRLLSDMLVEKSSTEFNEEHSLGLASILNNACESIAEVKNHLKTVSNKQSPRNN